MTIYTRSQAVANKLLKKYGTAVKITRQGVLICKPTGVWVESKKDNSTAPTDASNTTADARTFVCNGTFTGVPLPGDDLTIGTLTYRIMHVTSINPAGTTQIAYRLEVE
jgi:hypothetical protein